MTASSKSRAVSPSMVTMGRERKSRRCRSASRRNDRGNVLRLFQGRGGKMMRQVKLADHDFDVDAEIVLQAENFDDASAGILRWAWASR